MQRDARARTLDPKSYLTIPEAALRVGVSPDTIRRRVKSGALPAGFFAGKFRIRVEDLDELIRSEAVA